MKPQDIIEGARQRIGVDTLNPMQQYMLENAATPFLALKAPTGSGKTLAFAISLLLNLGEPGKGVKGVVLTPSRELTLQTYEVLRRLASGYKVTAIYGGHSVKEEKQSLSVDADIIVATPGRLLDHLQRGHLDIADAQVLVLDEWDKILQLGFADDMKKICRALPKKVDRLILTSATDVAELPQWLPVTTAPVVADFSGAQGLTGRRTSRMDVVEVPSAIPDKMQVLDDLLHSRPDTLTVVFVNHRESAERVAKGLRKAGFPVVLYHGALEQQERRKALEMFANGSRPILVATDLAARGLDIDDVENVIHYHMPLTEDVWTHRNGRTARMGRDGTVFVITSENDSIPEFISFDRTFVPPAAPEGEWHTTLTTLHFNLGKKDKISRGDIVGFLISKGHLEASQIGRIALDDRQALVAVDAAKARSVLDAVKGEKLKNKRVLVSLAKIP